MGQLTRDQPHRSLRQPHIPTSPLSISLSLCLPLLQSCVALTPGRDYADTVVGGIYARWKSRYGAFVSAVVK